MDKIIVRRSIGAWLIFAAIALFCIIQGITRLNHHASGGYLLIFIGAFVFVAAVIQLLITAPRVIIDDEGISVLVYGKRKIRWEDIRSAEWKDVPRSFPRITLILHDNTRLPFTLSGVNVSSEQVYAEITANISEHRVTTASQPETENEVDEDFN